MIFPVVAVFCLVPPLDPNPVPDGFFARLGDSRFHYEGGVDTFEFSPDEKRIALVTETGSLRVWDLASGRLLMRLDVPAGDFLGTSQLTFSPDSRFVLLQRTRPNVLEIWDIQTCRRVLRIPDVRERVTFAPDGRSFAIIVRNEIWILSFPEAVIVQRIVHKGSLTGSLKFSSDSTRLMYSDGDALCVWDLERQTMLARFATLAFIERALTSIGRELLVRLESLLPCWNLLSGRCKIPGPVQYFSRIDWAPGAERVAVLDLPGVVSLYDTRDGQRLFQWKAASGNLFADQVRVSPNGSWVAVSYREYRTALRIWNARTGIEWEPGVTHTAMVTHLHFIDNGRGLLSCGTDGRLIRWNLATRRGRELIRRDPYRDGASMSSPDGSLFATPGCDRPHLWDTATGTEREMKVNWSGATCGYAFSPDGRTLAIFREQSIDLCDARTGRLLWSKGFVGWPNPFCCLQFSPDGKRVAAALDVNATLHIWNVVSKKVECRIDGARSLTLAFSPDSRTLTWSEFGEGDALVCRDLKRGTDSRIPVEDLVLAIAYSPDGTLLAVSAGEVCRSRVYIYEVRTMRPIRPPFAPGASCISLAFSPNGQTVAAGLTDGTILLMDIFNRTVPRRGSAPSDNWSARSLDTPLLVGQEQ